MAGRPAVPNLTPFSQQNSQRLADEILQKVEEVPESLRDLVVSRAEGNPFFMEEVINMLIEEQVILKEDEHWRIDLSHQRASVFGRIFWDDAIGYMEQGLEDQAQIGPRMIGILALRRIYPAYAATWLETVTSQSRRSDEYAVMIAEHFERAVDLEKASIWYQRAGIQAADIYANAEAIRCLTRYLHGRTLPSAVDLLRDFIVDTPK